MRTVHSIKNISMSIFSQVIIVILGFVSRKIFLDNLSANYLGINGLLTNVLSMLVLLEGGIAISIVYNLYKPLAENNKEKIIALIQLYKKTYFYLSLIVLLISLCLYPFLYKLIKHGGSISNLTVIYFIFVLKSMVSYLNAHKWSLINADQRGYLLAKINLLFQVLSMIGKIAILIITQNYIFYLAVDFILYLIQLILNGSTVNKRYPYIKTKKKYKIDQETKENLTMNVKAMFLQNIGSYLVFSTDNILISSLIGIVAVGLYSNYTMITQQLSALVSPILSGIGASVGNLLVTESKEKSYLIFNITFFINFWIYSVCFIFLYNLLNSFIAWWLGEHYVLDQLPYIFILINFYLDGMRTAITTFKNKAGLFSHDKYASIIQGIINLVFSIMLSKYFGLAGIFIGTTISTLATLIWTQPYIVFKQFFKIPVWSYFVKYGFYTFLTTIICASMSFFYNSFLFGNTLILLIIKGLLCLLIPSLVYIIIFYKTKEFQYVLSALNNTLLQKWKLKKKAVS